MTRALPLSWSLLQLLLMMMMVCCWLQLLSAAGAQRVEVSSSQSKSFWNQIKANNEQRKADGGSGGGVGTAASATAAESPSLREVLESKKARRNRECRPDYCYRADSAQARSSAQICGTDGKTYESRCMLQFLRRCHGQKVKVRHLGACGAPLKPPDAAGTGDHGAGDGGGYSKQLSCQQSRLAALSQSSRGEQVIFVPQCRRDGNFRRVQCNYQLKYCFCVRKRSGKPLPGTGVQLPNRPRCKRRRAGGRSGRRRNGGSRKGNRGSPEQKNQQRQQRKNARKKKKNKGRKNGSGKRRKSGGRKNRCSSRQRAQFNRNILKQFEVEFNASVVTSRGGVFKPKREAAVGLPIHGVVEKTLQQPERRSAEWKFSELDANSDGQLSYRETKALRKVTRANIKPKNCARRFFSTCDLNSNKRLERAEWILCFGLENSQPMAPAAAGARAAAAAASVAAMAAAAEAAPLAAMVAAPATVTLAPFLGDIGAARGSGVSSSKGSLMELVSRRRKRNRAKKARPFAHKSCPLAREEAMAKNRQQRQRRHQGNGVAGGGQAFVPECSVDGKYVKRQCYSDAGAVAAGSSGERLCFCMDPDSGRVLKSRSGVGGGVGTVDCESAHLRARAAASAGSRGCTQPLLRQFAGQLTALLVQETRDAWTPQDSHLSVEARSLRLRFQRADVNRDGRLDRKEQRWWRRDLKARWQSSPRSRELRQTKKCAANFLRFCNADRDGFVTLQELQACLGFPAAA